MLVSTEYVLALLSTKLDFAFNTFRAHNGQLLVYFTVLF